MHDEAHTERGDEVTARTQLAMAAEQEAYKAQMGVLLLKRAYKRANATWAAVVAVGAIVTAGFIFRGRIDQFVTKDKVEAIEAAQAIDRAERARLADSLQSIKEMVVRMANQNDRIFDRLLPRERERGNGR